ncbi:class II fructose-bisphosphate aldolase [Microbacterium sp. Re1]|uniref:Class II fructose-bisphosphate aldolase n=1 Tax=Microbacterium commune TaxID=2762219 RepID=A0ABR8W551_9MICO|nr:class II fructose-bisphosphate aldolase [Microbacterium commune]MBD8012147.1 class II fructose-bisphosphate aldolase [Microbacterium commune]
MTLASPIDLIARREGRGDLPAVPAFNVIGLEHVEAFVDAADTLQVPLILQVSQNATRFRGGIRPFAAAIVQLASAASVPIAVQLDHADDVALVREAADAGVTSVMFDASTLEFEANVEQTTMVAAEMQARGIWVEGELGEIGGKDGAHAFGVRTDPRQAAAFVERTGVDGLAVAVGSSHAMMTQEAVLDLELIAELRDAVPVPLVLHGASGVSDERVAEACRAGVRKVNFGTRFNGAFTAALRDALSEYDGVDPRVYLRRGREALAADARHILSLFA